MSEPEWFKGVKIFDDQPLTSVNRRWMCPDCDGEMIFNGCDWGIGTHHTCTKCDITLVDHDNRIYPYVAHIPIT